MLLITVDGLRADAVSALPGASDEIRGLTPHLDALIADADWAGRAIAPSTATVPSIASLLTGLRPWQHQALLPDQAGLSEELLTLGEALQGLGYTTSAYVSGYWYPRGYGYQQGFDQYRALNRGSRAAGHLASLGAEADFLWIHLEALQPPYRLRGRVRRQLQVFPGTSGDELTAAELETYRNPLVPLPPEEQRRFLAFYRADVAILDVRIGRLLKGLRESGQWDRSTVVVVAAHGEEFGEQGQVGHSNNLGPATLEVPLIVKLPRGSGRTIQLPPGEPVAAARVWATLVELAGGSAAPAVPPSLFAKAPPGVVSELYLADGANHFSLVEGRYQLLREVRFGHEDDYYRARRRLAGARLPRPLDEPAEEVLARLWRVFERTPPFTGIAPGVRSKVREQLVEWTSTGVVPVDDAERRRVMAAELERRWRAFAPPEEPPASAVLRRPMAGPDAPP
ncbi:MAG: sulfatase-like hydrolase/transferase [Acidobacteria bacterium]|nr:sulfatase-like hydrolase/transferase [Acidobacteriota bacterium]